MNRKKDKASAEIILTFCARFMLFNFLREK